ncbi:poly(ADP-ribose) glycohydrolase-like [Condylostylus longicornis]|uniref:poly(ADP-ribose) glycohydrolase-like n=1 Tax=Condylostylus longicornis TaxID=2530218 RepID=UPI00244DCD94|nr:poly(ADP-ribose) glycohydrolase-like [Condylostylus longicornis]
MAGQEYTGNQYPQECEPIAASKFHKVLYELPFKTRGPPKPFDGKNGISRNNDFVLLPFSPDCSIKENYQGGGVFKQQLWNVIHESLSKPIKSSSDFENAIRKYSNGIGNFALLHNYLNKHTPGLEDFFDVLLRIKKLALELPNLIKTGVPFLRKGSPEQTLDFSISLSQQQISSLLANAFLCTFPKRNFSDRYPDINFNRLFELDTPKAKEKLLCILNYFRRVCSRTPDNVVTFTRRSISKSDFPRWDCREDAFSSINIAVNHKGSIEDNGKKFLRVDFANKYVGGGVLSRGCLQEEIQFLIHPELIISRLFTECLQDNEALIVYGAERFNCYEGYGDSFKFINKHFQDDLEIDSSKRRKSFIVAIDAIELSDFAQQYEKQSIIRELNKAYVGFYNKSSRVLPVASGNWGCGAFGGDADLKVLLQLMACAVTKRSLFFFTFGNNPQKKGIDSMHKFLIESNINVGLLFKYLTQFSQYYEKRNNLFEFIKGLHYQQVFSVSITIKL